jgi:hypothetical protein
MAESIKCEEDERYGLLFDVRRSVRYHTRRRRWFDRLHRITVFASVILGSATFASLNGTLLSPNWSVFFAAAITIISALDLVFSHAVRARIHHDFQRRWISLEREIIRAGVYDGSKYVDLCEKRLEIEAEEDPTMRVLDVLCHNEQVLADGHGDRFRVTFMQRLLANLTDWRAESPFKKIAS